jgi:hypothetical protein
MVERDMMRGGTEQRPWKVKLWIISTDFRRRCTLSTVDPLEAGNEFSTEMDFR